MKTYIKVSIFQGIDVSSVLGSDILNNSHAKSRRRKEIITCLRCGGYPLRGNSPTHRRNFEMIRNDLGKMRPRTYNRYFLEGDH